MSPVVTPEKLVQRLSHAIALVGLTLLLLQATAIVIDVVLRWVFNSPFFGLEDINKLLLAVILASFFPALLIDSKNITINFLGRALGPRVSIWFDIFGELVTLLLFVIVTWQLAIYASEIRSQTTLILQLPVAPAWWLTTSLIALCIPVQLVVVAGHLRLAIRGHDAPSNTQEQT